MIYSQFEKIGKDKKYHIIFGAGMIGKSWGYDVIVCAGYNVDYYYDNNIPAGRSIRDGIRTIGLERLKKIKEETVIFLAVTIKYQKAIFLQLQNLGYSNEQIVCIDYKFLGEMCESIAKMGGEKVRERYSPIVDDRSFLALEYKYNTGKDLCWNSIVSYNEKIQWLKLHDHNPLYHIFVDKYLVKKYIADCFGNEFVIPTLGIWNNAEEIEFDKLPNDFVIKCTHDSGSTELIRGKDNLDIISLKERLNNHLEYDYYWVHREWGYKGVVPRIIAEPYIVDESGIELKDYKFHCFNGKVEFIQVDYGRFSNHKRNNYTVNWEYIGGSIKYPTDKKHIIDRPINLEQMIDIANEISKGYTMMRVDLYNVNGKILFGEITLNHGAGYERFTPEKWEYDLGNLMDLSLAYNEDV